MFNSDASGVSQSLTGRRWKVTDTTGDETAWDTIRLFWDSGNFEALGTIYLYGRKNS